MADGDEQPTTGGSDDGREGAHRSDEPTVIGEQPSRDSQSPDPDPRHRK